MGDDFETLLSEWLSEVIGVPEHRRIVRSDRSSVLLSKFDDGFAKHLHEVLDQAPELFDAAMVSETYRDVARRSPTATRVAAWREAVDMILVRCSEGSGISEFDQASVRGGLDSVAALLEAVLWSMPLAGGDYTPSPGEIEAYRDATARMDDDQGIFTRIYGIFEGKRVVNHCPGSAVARVLFAQAWAVCTGT